MSEPSGICLSMPGSLYLASLPAPSMLSQTAELPSLFRQENIPYNLYIVFMLSIMHRHLRYLPYLGYYEQCSNGHGTTNIFSKQR